MFERLTGAWEAVCVWSLALVVGGCVVSPEVLAREAAEPLPGSPRVLVLGDSISQNGKWVEYLDAYYQTRRPDDRIEWINIGLSSETVSGLSEPGHPSERPHVHDRLETALATVQPDVVMVFYGMNDAIYSPFDADRFAAYQSGMRHVIDRIEQAGARPILMTPPPFDPFPIADRVVPIDAPEHGYQSPYRGYDYVLAYYGEWLLTLREQTYRVVDVGEMSRQHVLDRHAVDPRYTLAPDGVHPEEFGHWMIAQAVLDEFNAPRDVGVARIDAAEQAVSANVYDLEMLDGQGLQFRWSSGVPMPMDPRWPAELVSHERIEERYNRHRLIVTNLPEAAYALYEGDRRLATLTREQLAEGVDLLEFDDLTTNRRAAEILPLVRERQQMLSAAWREHAGYEARQQIEALPLDQAKVQAGAIERDIRDLARPVVLELRLVAAE